jgi:hypothetical protein
VAVPAAAAVLCVLLAGPAAGEGPPEPAGEVPAAGESSAEFEETRDRILSSLFFRGEVADAVLEAGLAGDFIETGGDGTYAGLRERLLSWIKTDPEQAARVYLYLKKGRDLTAERGYTYKEYSFEISPHFVGLIRSLEAAAAAGGASDEDLSAAGRRLFAGLSMDGENSAGGTLKAAPREPSSPSGAGSLVNADFRLDRAALASSARKLGAWAGSARSDLANAPGPRSGRRSVLLEKAFAGYRGLLAASSSVSGRGRITASEAGRLESLRLSVRSSLSAASLLAASDDLERSAEAMERAGRKGTAGRTRAAISELDRYGSRVEGGEAGARELGRLLAEGERIYRAASLYSRAALLLDEMSRLSSGRADSCLYDFLSDGVFSRLLPDSPYAAAKRDLARLGAAASRAAVLLENGDQAGAFAELSDGRGGASEDPAVLFSRSAAFFRSVSAANARAQYVAAGAVLNPLGLRFSKGGFGLAGLFPGRR